MTYDVAELTKIYEGSNGDATRALYDLLRLHGPAGEIALNLFRASKAAMLAKKYRGGNHRGSFRSQAYDKKGYSMDQLVEALREHAEAAGIRWGWGIDRVRSETDPFRHVLYLDLPSCGQVSFHGPRGDGPQYPGAWDGVRFQQMPRIVGFITMLLGTETHSARARRLQNSAAVMATMQSDMDQAHQERLL